MCKYLQNMSPADEIVLVTQPPQGAHKDKTLGPGESESSRPKQTDSFFLHCTCWSGEWTRLVTADLLGWASTQARGPHSQTRPRLLRVHLGFAFSARNSVLSPAALVAVQRLIGFMVSLSDGTSKRVKQSQRQAVDHPSISGSPWHA